MAISLMAAVPVGGFLLGLLNPGDPDSNPIGRLVYSCIIAVETSLHAGFPPHHEAETGKALNAWPHIAASFLLMMIFVVRSHWKSSNK